MFGLKALIYAGIPTVLLLWGLEAWARHTIQLLLPPNMPVPASMSQGDAPCFVPDLYTGYRPVGGRCGRNAEGFYSHDTGPAPSGTTRVLLVGDSIAENFIHADGLRDLLQAQDPSRPMQLWNGGISGYDTCSELQMLQRYGWDTHPQLVLHFFCVNDLGPSASVLYTPDGQVELVGGGQSFRMPSWMLHSRLLTWMGVRLATSRAWRPDHSNTYSATCYRQMIAAAQAHSTPLVTVLFPVLVTARSDRPPSKMLGNLFEDEARSRELLDASGQRWLDLRPAFSADAPIDRLGRGEADAIHPNQEGMDIAARTIAQFVAEQGVLRPSP